MITDPTVVVAEWTEAINRHDVDGALTFLSEDAVFTNTGTGERYVGPSENRRNYEGLFARWPEVNFEIVNLFSSGGHFVKEWIMTGVHRGDLPGFPANQRTFRVLGAGVGVVRDGLIADATEYWNFAALATQLAPVPTSVG